MPRPRNLRSAVAVLGLLMLGIGAWQVGWAGWIQAKAIVAQVLLSRAWAGTLEGAASIKPWPWADTYPVARLQVPALGIEHIVLDGASGRTLAFGPAHLGGTARPGAAGHTVVTGHRDTHFRFLEDLRAGTELRLQRPDGRWQSYRVTGSKVIDAHDAVLGSGDGRTALTLVTCYPFDTVTPGGPLRYLVFAEATPPRLGVEGP